MAVSGQLRPFRGVRLSEKREKKKEKLSREREREREGNHITPEDERCAAAHLPHFSPSFFRLERYTRPTIIIKQPKSKLIQAAREMNNPGTSGERNI